MLTTKINGCNTYVYCINNPIYYRDSFGQNLIFGCVWGFEKTKYSLIIKNCGVFNKHIIKIIYAKNFIQE